MNIYGNKIHKEQLVGIVKSKMRHMLNVVSNRNILTNFPPHKILS